jgi:hypothetical protein
VAPSARDGSKLGARRMRLGSGNRTPPTLGNVSRSSAATTPGSDNVNPRIIVRLLSG